ncbi:MAG: hypothetical protein N2572_06830 [Syntrophales bacterium]|nr:hypothetical protein [Syntrophales bacterium]
MPEHTCFHCGKPIEIKGLIGRKEVCPHCGYDLRVCKNCHHYAPGMYNDCRELQAERVIDKERANFCDFFVFRNSIDDKKIKEAEARRRLESLFRPRDSQ